MEGSGWEMEGEWKGAERRLEGTWKGDWKRAGRTLLGLVWEVSSARVSLLVLLPFPFPFRHFLMPSSHRRGSCHHFNDAIRVSRGVKVSTPHIKPSDPLSASWVIQGRREVAGLWGSLGRDLGDLVGRRVALFPSLIGEKVAASHTSSFVSAGSIITSRGLILTPMAFSPPSASSPPPVWRCRIRYAL
ncbi:hypothetical protein E2C01_054791 [Portunus trituberculatus]|uniref:Uncharacterized protein n=1 Tax=Portunus trituberculatus TaxID=210409 RepID=A0A5B7GTM4_PORTR|nr:hypothetical protein [Portunus trituberculatus]